MPINCSAGSGGSPASPTRAFSNRPTIPASTSMSTGPVPNSMGVNLAGSSQVAPTYYLNPDNGVSYSIVMQTPQYRMDSLSALETLPITAGTTAAPSILGGTAH